jgi:hypothetical protein
MLENPISFIYFVITFLFMFWFYFLDLLLCCQRCIYFYFQNKCNSSLFKIVDSVWPIHGKEIQLYPRHLEVNPLEMINWSSNPFGEINLSFYFLNFLFLSLSLSLSLSCRFHNIPSISFDGLHKDLSGLYHNQSFPIKQHGGLNKSVASTLFRKRSIHIYMLSKSAYWLYFHMFPRVCYFFNKLMTWALIIGLTINVATGLRLYFLVLLLSRQVIRVLAAASFKFLLNIGN